MLATVERELLAAHCQRQAARGYAHVGAVEFDYAGVIFDKRAFIGVQGYAGLATGDIRGQREWSGRRAGDAACARARRVDGPGGVNGCLLYTSRCV